MKTISKCDNRKVIFSGMEEGHAIIAEHTAYLTPGYKLRKWEKSIVALSLEELREILKAAESVA